MTTLVGPAPSRSPCPDPGHANQQPHRTYPHTGEGPTRLPGPSGRKGGRIMDETMMRRPSPQGDSPPPDDIRQVTEQEALEALEEAGWRA